MTTNTLNTLALFFPPTKPKEGYSIMQITWHTNTFSRVSFHRHQIILDFVPGDLPVLFRYYHWEKKILLLLW